MAGPERRWCFKNDPQHEWMLKKSRPYPLPATISRDRGIQSDIPGACLRYAPRLPRSARGASNRSEIADQLRFVLDADDQAVNPAKRAQIADRKLRYTAPVPAHAPFAAARRSVPVTAFGGLRRPMAGDSLPSSTPCRKTLRAWTTISGRSAEHCRDAQPLPSGVENIGRHLQMLDVRIAHQLEGFLRALQRGAQCADDALLAHLQQAAPGGAIPRRSGYPRYAASRPADAACASARQEAKTLAFTASRTAHSGASAGTWKSGSSLVTMRRAGSGSDGNVSPEAQLGDAVIARGIEIMNADFHGLAKDRSRFGLLTERRISAACRRRGPVEPFPARKLLPCRHCAAMHGRGCLCRGNHLH